MKWRFVECVWGELWLEIAAGDRPILDDVRWWHHDFRDLPHIEIVCDWRDLRKYVRWFHRVRSLHFIEHLTLDEAQEFLDLCKEIMVVGGRLDIITPNLFWLCRHYLSGGYNFDTSEMSYWVFGAQDHDWNYHKCLFDAPLLCRMMKRAGFKITSIDPYKFRLHVTGEKLDDEIPDTTGISEYIR